MTENLMTENKPLTREEAIARLNADEAILCDGTRIVREGMDWCVTHANGAFEMFPAAGFGRVRASDLVDRMSLLESLDA